MTVNTQSTVAGIFSSQEMVERAIDELHHAGFSDEQIGFAVKDKRGLIQSKLDSDEVKTHAIGVTTGAVGGSVVGGLISTAVALLIPGFGPVLAGGVLAAALSGTVLGALTGGFIGALMTIGIPEEKARYYQHELESGHFLVTVDAGNRDQEALDILRFNGAYNTTIRTEDATLDESHDIHENAPDYNPNIPPGATQ
jgi:hypothetical protein